MADKVSAAVVEPPPGEHIFPNTRLTEVCLRWKDLTAQAVALTAKAAKAEKANEKEEMLKCSKEASAKHGEAFRLLEQIIIESTPMFERLAQYKGYHHTVDLRVLVQAAREKVPRWLIACDVKRLHEGKLFSWFSICAKNAFRSELAKQRQYSMRYHSTSDSLEKFVGTADHDVDLHDAAAEVQRRVQEICVRWGDPQELGAVRFIVDCLIDQERYQGRQEKAVSPNKVAIIRGAMYAYGLSEEMTKFFYQWALFALRDALFDCRRVPFTRQDILRQQESYTFWPDVIDIVGWDKTTQLIMKLGGQRLKIPTVAQLERAHEDRLIRDELDKTDLTPEDFEATARRRGRSTRNASDIFAELTDRDASQWPGEHPLYPGDDNV